MLVLLACSLTVSSENVHRHTVSFTTRAHAHTAKEGNVSPHAHSVFPPLVSVQASAAVAVLLIKLLQFASALEDDLHNKTGLMVLEDPTSLDPVSTGSQSERPVSCEQLLSSNQDRS